MIVFADTSPLNYLVLIQEIEILRAIYAHVVIPPAVRTELLHPSADKSVRAWIASPSSWIEVRAPAIGPDSLLESLDKGEQDAILLAQELQADQLIVDDRRGRRAAEKRGISVIGTLGVLREAGSRRLLDFRIALKRLQALSFYVAPEVLERLLND